MRYIHVPSFVEIGPPVPEKKIFKGFYHIWAWRPYWSCDPDATNKILFLLPKEAPHKIWLAHNEQNDGVWLLRE